MIGEDLTNTKINIMVHMHRLPYELRNQTFAKEITAISGTVKEENGSKLEFGSSMVGEFLKFRIALDTTVPIVPDFFLNRENRKQVWIHFKYAKLPNVCFICGKLNKRTMVVQRCSGSGCVLRIILGIYLFGMRIKQRNTLLQRLAFRG